MARGPREVRTGYPEERALQGHLRGGREERAGGAEETACTKAGKLRRVRQVGIPVNYLPREHQLQEGWTAVEAGGQ